MKKLLFLALVLMFLSITITGQKSLAGPSETKKKTTSILLGGYNAKEKCLVYQSYEISDKTNLTPKKQFSIRPDHKKFKYFYTAGITDNYICFQGMDKSYHRREEDDKPTYSLMLYKIGEDNMIKPVFEKKYEGYPGTAFYAIGDQLFIGSNNEVRLATFKDNSITMKLLHNFEGVGGSWNFHNKTIDAFVRFGDNLMAIDDVISPFYAFIFDIKNPNNPKYTETVDLPQYINLHYADAVSDNETIYALANYGHRGGSGFLIYALKYEKEKVYVKYVYHIEQNDEELNDETRRKYWDYPLLYRKIYVVGDKIILIGVDGLIELSANPKIEKSEDDKLLSVEEYNGENYEKRKKITVEANDLMKIHKFDGMIISIDVKDDVIYAMMIDTQKLQTKPKSDDDKPVEKKNKLLVLKYDKDNELKTLKTIEVEQPLSGIYSK